MYRVAILDKQYSEENCTLDASLPIAAGIIVAITGLNVQSDLAG